jgi:abelson tyrosine-protein kinase 1/abelson tyrosine-protein kinase 2
MNRLASLRLAERCADILISVREEIIDAGYTVAEELHAPISKLNECGHSSIRYVTFLTSLYRAFAEVLYFLTKLGHRPFLKRYLKRDEILSSITSCDAVLNDALGMFGVCFVFYYRHPILTHFVLAALYPDPHSQDNPSK